MDVSLVMFKADGHRRDFAMRKDRIIIGRKNTCDLRIPLSSVSRQHCEIRVSGHVAKVRDLGSSNGTYHNSTRVQESVLSPGDEIVVGPVVFTIVIDGQPEHIKPVRTLIHVGNDEIAAADDAALDEPTNEENEAVPALEGSGAALTPHAENMGARATPRPQPHAQPKSAGGQSQHSHDPLSALQAFPEGNG